MIIQILEKIGKFKLENEVRLIDGKYVLVELKIHKFLSSVEAAGLINKELAIDTTGDFPKFGEYLGKF